MVSKTKDQAIKGKFEFTQSWFRHVKPIWDIWVPQLKPSKILEIGSYEGMSACYLIDKCTQWHDVEIHCIDTWDGGAEHKLVEIDMFSVQGRFDNNISLVQQKAPRKVSLEKHKSPSYLALAKLISSGKLGYFDLIYIDGSHQASDVLTDAVMAFPLLKVGGMIVFDDYLWRMEEKGHQDLLSMPKLAIDSFTNIFQREIKLLNFPLRQIYAQRKG